jgi:hypothetical protein
VRDIGLDQPVALGMACEADALVVERDRLELDRWQVMALVPDVEGCLQECGSAWKRDPGSGVIGVEKGPLIPVV